MDALLAINDDEGAGFHLQQAAEKYLKGYLLGRGWQLKRTHDLDDLIDDALQFDAYLETFREACRFSGEFYVSERYPFPLVSVPSRTQLDVAIRKIKEMITYIVQHTPTRK
ncbi:MAG: HEPN domain-containing protein [Chloroflexota bacterium]|nr:HEPN domain-containing protein [Chloroflexota bacterium]